MYAEALVTDGVAQVLEIETSTEGEVTVRHFGQEGGDAGPGETSTDSGSDSADAAIPPCQDSLYQFAAIGFLLQLRACIGI